MRFLRARWWIAAAVLVALAPGARVYHHFFPPAPLHAGDRLTPVALSSVTGAPFTLARTGHPTLINIFATWCGPCRMETPDLAQAAERLRARGVEVIGVDQEESATRVESFAREFGVKYPIYIDSNGALRRMFGARFIPTTIYMDGNGRIRWVHPGPLTGAELSHIAETPEVQV